MDSQTAFYGFLCGRAMLWIAFIYQKVLLILDSQTASDALTQYAELLWIAFIYQKVLLILDSQTAQPRRIQKFTGCELLSFIKKFF